MEVTVDPILSITMKGTLYFSDLLALENEFQALVGARLQRIYDAGPTHTYLLKFAVDDPRYTSKQTVWLLFRPGIGVYPVKDPPTERRMMPSSFCGKLRRLLANRRLTEVSHFGTDRILRFYFGEGGLMHCLVMELYGEGNLALCDGEGKLVQFIHPHVYKEQRMRVGQPHPYWNITRREGEWDLEAELDRLVSVEEANLLQSFGADVQREMEGGDLEGVRGKLLEIKGDQGYTLKGKWCVPVLYDYLIRLHDASLVQTHNSFGEAIESHVPPLAEGMTKQNKKGVPKVTKGTKSLEQRMENVDKAHQKKMAKLSQKVEVLYQSIEILEANPDEATAQIEALRKASLDTTKNGFQVLEWIDVSGCALQIDVALSYYDNIARLHTERKACEVKMAKAERGHQTALQTLEETSRRSNQCITKESTRIRLDRTGWYQAHHWFRTSGGFLVVCGRDSTGSETLVKRHMERHDIYLHSEAAGSGSCILKNPDKKEVSPKDLVEAGSFVVAHSQTWKMKVADRAYWVHPDQVSKTAPTGEFVEKGAFIIRGTRNYMVARPLELAVSLVDGRLHVSPPSAVSRVRRVKITPGKGKRNARLEQIMNHLGICKADKDYVDARLPRPVQVFT